MRIKTLHWDSNFFGLKIAKVDVASPEDSEKLLVRLPLLHKQYDLLYVFSQQKIEAFDEDVLCDCKVIYLQSVSPAGYHPNVWKYARLTTVSKDLLHLALESGEYSRFRLDGKFPRQSYEKLYTRWIEQSVSGNISTDVFCYIKNDNPCGLLTLNIQKNNAVIGLLSTAVQWRGKGIASALLSHVRQYAFDKNVQSLSVATQESNINACRLYEKNGFMKSSATYVYHVWVKDFMQYSGNQCFTPPRTPIVR